MCLGEKAVGISATISVPERHNSRGNGQGQAPPPCSRHAQGDDMIHPHAQKKELVIPLQAPFFEFRVENEECIIIAPGGVSLKLNAWDKNITFFQVVGLIGLIRLIWLASSETSFLRTGLGFWVKLKLMIICLFGNFCVHLWSYSQSREMK